MANSRLAVGILAVTLLMGGGAGADIPEQGFFIGLHGGGHLVLDDWDLAVIGDRGIAIKHGPTAGIRIGGHMTWWLAIEGALGVLPLRASAPAGEDGFNLALSYSGELLVHLIRGEWAPVIGGGGGGYHNIMGDLGSDLDYRLHYGIGLRGMVTSWLALRFDGRHVLTDGHEGARDKTLWANNVEVSVGLDFYLARAQDDWDGDGVEDTADECPEEAGQNTAAGCPDRDFDTFPDPDDACPDQAGHKTAGGCPDKDGDSVVDEADRCAMTPGLTQFDGCPDTDDDNIEDGKDTCPDVPGVRSAGGCPDADTDGITDADDACPRKHGPKKYKGCPDTDSDGIADNRDKCPLVAGVKKEHGCLPKAVVAKFSGAIEGIYFKAGKADIKPKSFKVLNEAAKVLSRYPSVRVLVEGHTDSKGNDASNLKLSQKRAEAVREYFVIRGIDEKRIEAFGRGETKPIADNKTRKGRAKNRRIEIRVISQ